MMMAILGGNDKHEERLEALADLLGQQVGRVRRGDDVYFVVELTPQVVLAEER